MWFKLIFFFFTACWDSWHCVETGEAWTGITLKTAADLGEVSRRKGKFMNQTMLCQIWGISYDKNIATILVHNWRAYWMTGETSSRNKEEPIMIKRPQWLRTFTDVKPTSVSYWRQNCSNRMRNVILLLWIWCISVFENQQPPAQVFSLRPASVKPYLTRKMLEMVLFFFSTSCLNDCNLASVSHLFTTQP